ncbi:hypothetical protein [Amycolatopsis vancoresmycina]|uniref:Uncharacterized protein n=1 Tax=Amycolatopsis vancoresmycina DSM 44592 TaxID=1292037 RepID=R1GEU6_9PSEU|nr:hypothetical protein [Amycolatopsis vancoresmycina]EOD69817.1 hypothetical protein H480_04217 [Amycolatopsis vancoresmycina DSM 44592]
MDEDYAQRLRNWLRAEPEPTPRRAAEQRDWLREVPEPGARSAHDRLPAAEVPEPGARAAHDRLPSAETPESGARATHDRLPAAEVPEPGARAAHDPLPSAETPEPGARAAQNRLPAAETPAPLADEPNPSESWTVRGYLPEAPGDDDWVCPVITLPVPRPSRENGCRMSGVEARRSAAGTDRRTPAPEASRMSDGEARSRWNHPTNWHRRRREAEQHLPEEPRGH